MRKHEREKYMVYLGFMNLEMMYDKVNREALRQVLGMYDVVCKLLNGIKSMYINSLACIRVKWVESECFRIDSGVRQDSIISPLLFNVHMDSLMKEMKMGWGRGKKVDITRLFVCK